MLIEVPKGDASRHEPACRECGEPWPCRTRREEYRYAYIAGPVTGIRDYNLPAFEAARVLLRRHVERPRRIVIPHDLAEPGWSEAQAMSECLSFICETVDDGFDFTMVLLPGWRESLGTAVEVALARKLGVPIYELRDGELVLLSPDKTNECPRCGNSGEHSNPGTSDKEGQRG